MSKNNWSNFRKQYIFRFIFWLNFQNLHLFVHNYQKLISVIIKRQLNLRPYSLNKEKLIPFDDFFSYDNSEGIVGMIYKIITPLICKYSYYKTP